MLRVIPVGIGGIERTLGTLGVGVMVTRSVCVEEGGCGGDGTLGVGISSWTMFIVRAIVVASCNRGVQRSLQRSKSGLASGLTACFLVLGSTGRCRRRGLGLVLRRVRAGSLLGRELVGLVVCGRFGVRGGFRVGFVL